MRDGLARQIRYLRLSITDACAMRCIYCRPQGLQYSRHGLALTPVEIERLVRHLVEAHGLRKVRLTGGEPTSRAELPEIVRRLAGIEELDELSMTTNGLTLSRQAATLAAAGLHRVNISLDSLDVERFRQITGIDGLGRVLAGIDACKAAGLKPVKLNTVVVRGQNDTELPDLLQFAAERQLEIRLIELMPMGPLAHRWRERFVSEEEMRDRLVCAVKEWEVMSSGSAAARSYWAYLTDGRQVRVGFISAMSCPFCGNCDRMRIASDGTFYPCLMDRPAGSILPALRPVWRPDLLNQMLNAGLKMKAPEHPACGVSLMTRVGG